MCSTMCSGRFAVHDPKPRPEPGREITNHTSRLHNSIHVVTSQASQPHNSTRVVTNQTSQPHNSTHVVTNQTSQPHNSTHVVTNQTSQPHNSTGVPHVRTSVRGPKKMGEAQPQLLFSSSKPQTQRSLQAAHSIGGQG